VNTLPGCRACYSPDTITSHPDVSNRALPLLAILALGTFAQVAQALLIREGLVVFYGNEISLGLFYGSWLLWLAVGSAVALRWGERRPRGVNLPALRLALLAAPLVLAGQVLALRSVRLVLDIGAGELVPLGDLFLALSLVNLPGGLLLGWAFPIACAAVGETAAAAGPDRRTAAVVPPVASTYVADALGALFGGLLFTFVLIRWAGLVQTLGLATALLALTAALLPAAPAGRTARWLPWPLALAGLILALPPVAHPLEWRMEQWRFASLQPGMQLLDAVETPYGHVAVARLVSQTSVVGDGQVQQSFPLPLEVERESAYFLAQAPGARRVLVLGGYAGGLTAGLLRYPVEQVDQVEQDGTAFARIKPFLDPAAAVTLDDPRLTLHFTDGRRFLRGLPDATRYDLILSLDAAPTSAAGNRYFTREAFALVRAHLNPDGVFCTRVSAAANYLGDAVRGYAGSVYRTLRSVFGTVVLVPGEAPILCAADTAGRLTEDPTELQRRYLATPLPSHPLPVGTFATLLPLAEVAYLHGQLDAALDRAEIDRDARPVTYYLNMVLWGEFSGSGLVDWLPRLHGLGPWPYLLPPLVFVALWLARRLIGGGVRVEADHSATVFALATLGFIAMAGQLVLLLRFQAEVGVVFERIALLNGLFMTGLAVGAGGARSLATGRQADLALMAAMGAAAIGLVLLPAALEGLALLPSEAGREAGYLVLTLVLGLAAGAGFTLCVGIAPDGGGAASMATGGRVLRRGGLAMAADSLGGALGGLVTGALMVPTLGIAGTCHVLAGFALLTWVPLGWERFARAHAPRPATVRAEPSFPWPALGWGLIYAVLLVYAWHLLDARSRPGPTLHFDPGVLAEVGGPGRYDLVETPLVHYLGREPGDARPRTVVLASAAAAPDVSGFAGPIQLLLAVDADGTLRGVRYLDSRETPSYITGIAEWLARLTGTDLAQGPLTLARVDGLSGATVTSRAVLATINRAAGRATTTAFGRAMPPPAAPGGTGADLSLWATALLLALCIPVYLSGSERARLALLAAALVVLGLWLNTLVTEVDLVNLSEGHVAAPAENPGRWLLLGFTAFSAILFGPVWCGCLCPFGALQEFISRLGRRLGLRAYPVRPLEQAARALQFVLLAALLILVWTTGDAAWATFNPMQHCFSGRLGGAMLALTGLVLAACLFHYRFWCRYLCPFGALLTLSNKVALLQHLTPRRRFAHCDLGVRGEYDLDCIRCNRCLTGADTHAARVPLASLQRPGAD
jgi:spermidine synthase